MHNMSYVCSYFGISIFSSPQNHNLGHSNINMLKDDRRKVCEVVRQAVERVAYKNELA